jgi:hypothetical protein
MSQPDKPSLIVDRHARQEGRFSVAPTCLGDFGPSYLALREFGLRNYHKYNNLSQ